MLKCKFSIPKTLYLMDQKRRFVSSTHDSLTFFCFIRLSSSFFKLKNYFITFFVFIRNFISCSLELESTYSNEILMKACGNNNNVYFKEDVFMFQLKSLLKHFSFMLVLNQFKWQHCTFNTIEV